MKIHVKNRHGQVSLEAAIAFTIAFVFLAAVVSAIDFYRTDILMRRSVEQTCEKMSLLYPVSVPASDFLSAAVNAFPDLGIGDTKGAGVIAKVASAALGIDRATGHTLKDLILQGVFSHTMEESTHLTQFFIKFFVAAGIMYAVFDVAKKNDLIGFLKDGNRGHELI